MWCHKIDTGEKIEQGYLNEWENMFASQKFRFSGIIVAGCRDEQKQYWRWERLKQASESLSEIHFSHGTKEMLNICFVALPLFWENKNDNFYKSKNHFFVTAFCRTFECCEKGKFLKAFLWMYTEALFLFIRGCCCCFA